MSATALDAPYAGTPGRGALRDRWLGALAGAVALAAEASLWLAVQRRWLDFGTAIAAHIVIVGAISAVVAMRWRRDGRAPPLLALLALATALLGPFGAAGALLTCLVQVLTRREAASFDEWYRTLFPEEDETDELESVERMAEGVIAGGGRVSIGPLLDVLSHGTRPQKQIAIGVFTRKFHPAFAPALRMALRDADSAIRVQAATSMTMIENNFLKRAIELEEAAAAAPEAPGPLKALARHHDDYAYTGVLDPVRERRSRVVALRTYIKYLRLNPADAEARLAATRLFYHRRKFAVAASWLEQCIRDGLFTITMAPWYMDCLYKLRRYGELRTFARKHATDLTRLDLFPIKVTETARLWSSDEAAPAERPL